jgi:hypothetical protein
VLNFAGLPLAWIVPAAFGIAYQLSHSIVQGINARRLFSGPQNIHIGDCAGLTAGGLSLEEENTEAGRGDQQYKQQFKKIRDY